MFQGTPEALAAHGRGHTARYLRAALERGRGRHRLSSLRPRGAGVHLLSSTIMRMRASPEPSPRPGVLAALALCLAWRRARRVAAGDVRRPGREPQEPDGAHAAGGGAQSSARAGAARRWRRCRRSCAIPSRRCASRWCGRCARLRDLSGDPGARDVAAGRRPDDPRGGDRDARRDLRRARPQRRRSTASWRPSPTSTTAPRCRPTPTVDPSVFRGLSRALRDEKTDIRAERPTRSASSAAAARSRTW